METKTEKLRNKLQNIWTDIDKKDKEDILKILEDIERESLMTKLTKLGYFQQIFKGSYNVEPSLLSKDEYDLRFKLLEEENKEYLEACKRGDIVEIFDALGDSLYIILGSIVSHGGQNVISNIFHEIHESNMSKLNEDGEPIINGVNGFDSTRPEGKVLKGDNFKEPNIKQFL